MDDVDSPDDLATLPGDRHSHKRRWFLLRVDRCHDRMRDSSVTGLYARSQRYVEHTGSAMLRRHGLGALGPLKRDDARTVLQKLFDRSHRVGP